MPRCFVGLLVAGACLAQTAGEATLSGKVTDAATHQPIEGAVISYRGGPGGKPDSVTTGGDGAYSIRLPAGLRAGLAISKTGYATLDLASSDATSVRLKAGRAETRDFELSKPGTLAGRLTDKDTGKPLAGFYIHAIRWFGGMENNTGFRYPSPPTAEDGSFSIGNLPPAKYVLVIDPPMAGKITAVSSESAEKKDFNGYGPAWYPGVPRADMAAPILLGYAENRRIEVRLQKHELLHIAGDLTIPHDMKTGAITLTLTTAEKGRPTGAEGQVTTAGGFRIDGLEAGSYRVLAAARTSDGKALYASLPVELSGRSADDLDLQLRPGVTLKATVEMLEDKAEPPARFQFVPISQDGWGPMDEGPPGGEVRMTRTGLPPGKYNIAVMRMPGYALASMLLNGVKMPAGAPVELESAESTLTFVLTKELGGLSGVVRDTDDQPVPETSVVIVAESALESRGDQVGLQPGSGEVLITDADGRFNAGELAAGQYRVLAFRTENGRRALDSATRERMRTAQSVTVSARQIATVTLVAGN